MLLRFVLKSGVATDIMFLSAWLLPGVGLGNIINICTGPKHQVVC